jgi:hypothetical protein
LYIERFDIAYATSAVSRSIMMPRQEHLKAVKRILSYLKSFSKGRIIVDPSYPVYSIFLTTSLLHYPTKDHTNWSEFYRYLEEETPNDLLKSKGPNFRMTVADHEHDLVTRQSITGIFILKIIHLLEGYPSVKTVESSAYGSDLVASSISTVLIVED